MCQICDRLRRILDHSSALQRTMPSELLLRWQAVTHTYGDQGLGLKILVSAVQSRPSPPFFSAICPSENFSRTDFVPRFVPSSGTFQRIPAHEALSEGPRRARRKSLRRSPSHRVHEAGLPWIAYVRVTVTRPFFGGRRGFWWSSYPWGGLVPRSLSSKTEDRVRKREPWPTLD